jgi:hypothetical protein
MLYKSPSLGLVLRSILCDVFMSRAAESGFGPSSKGRPAKNLYSTSEWLTLSCRKTWAWFERFNLYIWQVMILLRNKIICTMVGPQLFAPALPSLLALCVPHTLILNGLHTVWLCVLYCFKKNDDYFSRHHVLFGSGNVNCVACEVTIYFLCII